MNCPKCQKPVPDNAQFCPHCGSAGTSPGGSSPASGEPLPSDPLLQSNLAASRHVAGMLRYSGCFALLVALIAAFISGRFKALPTGGWAIVTYIALGIAAVFFYNWIRILGRVGRTKGQIRQANRT